MRKIEEYRFGYMKINGKQYNKDLIINGDNIIENWWRKKGHFLCMDDLKNLNIEKVNYFIVGKGYYGAMEIDKEVLKFFRERKIPIFLGKTQDAAEKYNEVIQEKDKVLAAFHLTC